MWEGTAMRLFSPLAARSPRLRLALTLEIECDCGADESLQGCLINLVPFVNIDGAPEIPVKAGIEETGRVLQGSSLGKRHLDHILVCLARADDAAMGPDGSPRRCRLDPLPLFGNLRVCREYDFAHFRERLPAPVPKFLDLRVDRCRGRLQRDGPIHVELQFSHLI